MSQDDPSPLPAIAINYADRETRPADPRPGFRRFIGITSIIISAIYISVAGAVVLVNVGKVRTLQKQMAALPAQAALFSRTAAAMQAARVAAAARPPFSAMNVADVARLNAMIQSECHDQADREQLKTLAAQLAVPGQFIHRVHFRVEPPHYASHPGHPRKREPGRRAHCLDQS